MGIREKINQNPKPYVFGAAALIAVGIGLVVWSMRKDGGDAGVKGSGKAFFTEDDGKTRFEAPYEKLGDPNFKGPNGNDAVLARVFQYPGEPPFVAYLETYTEKGKQLLAQFYADPKNKGMPPPEVQVELERLVKRPGAEEWAAAAQASEVIIVEQKDGKTAVPVLPK